MDLFETVLLILLVLVSVGLGALVLIQQSKGADIGAAFGSGAANTLFGSSGATSFVVKFTATLAISYFLIAFGLAYTAKERAASLSGYQIEDVPALNVEGDQLPTDSESIEGTSEDLDTGLPLEGDDMPLFDSTESEGTEGTPDSATETTDSDDSAEIPDI